MVYRGIAGKDNGVIVKPKDAYEYASKRVFVEGEKLDEFFAEFGSELVKFMATKSFEKEFVEWFFSGNFIEEEEKENEKENEDF